MNGPLDSYRNSKYSQHGEDGILEFLTGKLGITKGWCMEFGAFDGTIESNTLALIEQGWHGLYVEPDPEHRPALEALAKQWPKLTVLFAYIEDGVAEPAAATPVIHIDAALDQAGWPRDFGVLSIDVEEQNRVVWAMLADYRPRIVVIEINSSKIIWMHAMVRLGQSKGYTCLGHCGNLVFVRDEDFDALGIAREEVADLDRLYTPNEEDW